MIAYVTSVEGIGTQYLSIAEFSLAQKCGAGIWAQGFLHKRNSSDRWINSLRTSNISKQLAHK